MLRKALQPKQSDVGEWRGMKAARANRATSRGDWVSPGVHWGTTKVLESMQQSRETEARQKRVMALQKVGKGR